jgi:hypothetical protein
MVNFAGFFALVKANSFPGIQYQAPIDRSPSEH